MLEERRVTWFSVKLYFMYKARDKCFGRCKISGAFLPRAFAQESTRGDFHLRVG